MAEGLFTRCDLMTIGRAAAVSEVLTQKYFDLAGDEWKRDPYDVLTRQHVNSALYERDVFASVIRYGIRTNMGRKLPARERYGIVLQDPNILLALLRSKEYDLWTLGLFILTHEMIHIVRFRKFGVDFFASVDDRDREERVVHGITREILSGAANAADLLRLYENQAAFVPETLLDNSPHGGA
jgi:hypothetical protein